MMKNSLERTIARTIINVAILAFVSFLGYGTFFL